MKQNDLDKKKKKKSSRKGPSSDLLQHSNRWNTVKTEKKTLQKRASFRLDTLVLKISLVTLKRICIADVSLVSS